MNRRDFGRAMALFIYSVLHPSPIFAQSQNATEADAVPFDHDKLIDLARRLAAEPNKAPPEVDDSLKKMGYDLYRDIRFRQDAQIWNGEERGFTVDLLHGGFIYRELVEINLVENGLARRIPYQQQLFDFGPKIDGRDWNSPGYSGFRLRSTINNAEHLDEFAVFQGASYFRAVGQKQNYGLSARGLNIATGAPKGEEFPIFRAYWIERPEAYAKTVTVHALLDSVSATGAYRFRITPGPVTRMEVDATLFARVDLKAYGLAPLTSMFLFNPSTVRHFDDFRTAVHDSDGLLVKRSNGEWFWRPLCNPERLELSYFADTNPVGFGLLQRSQKVSDFSDFEARYELRPSAWVEPKGKWGKGEVVLVEIPTKREINDNIVAFWRPEQPLKAGSSRSFGYWLSWGPPPPTGNLAHVASTRTGLALHGGGRIFVVDFAPPPQSPQALQANVEPHVWASGGKITDVSGHFDAPTNLYRLTFRLTEDSGEPIELGGVLRLAGAAASETWLYRWINP